MGVFISTAICSSILSVWRRSCAQKRRTGFISWTGSTRTQKSGSNLFPLPSFMHQNQRSLYFKEFWRVTIKQSIKHSSFLDRTICNSSRINLDFFKYNKSVNCISEHRPFMQLMINSTGFIEVIKDLFINPQLNNKNNLEDVKPIFSSNYGKQKVLSTLPISIISNLDNSTHSSTMLS